jgi:hypothetical protein
LNMSMFEQYISENNLNWTYFTLSSKWRIHADSSLWISERQVWWLLALSMQRLP